MGRLSRNPRKNFSPSVNYLTLLNRFLNDPPWVDGSGRSYGKCRLKRTPIGTALVRLFVGPPAGARGGGLTANRQVGRNPSLSAAAPGSSALREVFDGNGNFTQRDYGGDSVPAEFSAKGQETL